MNNVSDDMSDMTSLAAINVVTVVADSTAVVVVTVMPFVTAVLL